MIVLSDGRVVGVGASAGTLGRTWVPASRWSLCYFMLTSPLLLTCSSFPRTSHRKWGQWVVEREVLQGKQLFIPRAWKADPAGRRVENMTSVLGSNNKYNFSSATDGI